jgi:hypothetical protein
LQKEKAVYREVTALQREMAGDLVRVADVAELPDVTAIIIQHIDGVNNK